MPENLPADLLIQAQRAINHAQDVREYHRRRTPKSSPQRQTDIKVAEDRLASAMRPLRSVVARFPYGPQTETAAANRAAIIEISRAIQRERRKLFKMRPKKGK